jgi:hypothetical protein
MLNIFLGIYLFGSLTAVVLIWNVLVVAKWYSQGSG